jgi:serine/threonine-protein kinase
VDTTLQDPLVGRVVDNRYLVESRIARGGMATVYLALDRRLDRQVALKVLFEHLVQDEELAGRFVREARAAARLSHPNIVQVFDQGSDGDLLYIAMEYLPGRTLRDVLVQRGALTPRESVSVMEPVLSALSVAHRAGIVHRDLKPENVILTDDGRIKVADFGLARAVSAPISSLTSGGGKQIHGTVAYLAPELVSRGVADARADVYAAGIMLFEVLTGKQPFTGEDPLQVAYRHVYEDVPAPSAVAPDLPRAFDPVVLQATDHDPDVRPHDAGAMLAELLHARGLVPDAELDVRAADATTVLDLDAAGAMGGPAPAYAPQATRAFEMPAEPPRPPMLPRLRVNDDEPPLPPDGRRQVFAWVGAAVAVVLVIFLGFWWFTGGPGSYTTTPSVTGQRLVDAQHELTGLGLHNQVQSVFSTDVASGQVVSTDPVAGRKVKKNGTVVLSVSKGPQLITVPNVAGQSADAASGAITAVGLKVGDSTQKYSSTVAQGQVISTAPDIGSKLAPGRAVDLVVSKGAQPEIVPNLVGQNIDDAVSALKGVKLKAQKTPTPYTPGGPQPNTVTNQDAGAGSTVNAGTLVTLTYVQLPAGWGIVPDETGKSFEDAQNDLQSAGFQAQRGGIPFGDKVKGQSVTGAAQLGTTVTLFVGL